MYVYNVLQYYMTKFLENQLHFYFSKFITLSQLYCNNSIQIFSNSTWSSVLGRVMLVILENYYYIVAK